MANQGSDETPPEILKKENRRGSGEWRNWEMAEKTKAKMIERKKKKMSMKDKNKTMAILEYLYLIAYLKYLDHHLLKNSFKTEVNPWLYSL